jgi:4-carboxymuconolactone decarboxylase
MDATPQTAARVRGLDLLRRLHGGHAGTALVAEMDGVSPAFADMTIDWALGTVLARPGLDLKTRELALVAACTALGHATPQAVAHGQAAMAAGATREEVVETVLQTTFYASGPAIRAVLLALKQALPGD